MISILLIVVTAVAIGIAVYFQKNKRKWFLADQIPGPIRLPIVGNGYLFNKNGHDNFLTLQTLVRTYGNVLRLYFGPSVLLLVSGVKEVEAILSSQKLLEKSDEYRFLNSWLGTGLLTSTGKKWHARRKIITPTFHFKILEQFIDVFDEHSAVMVKRMAPYADNGEKFDVFPFVTLCALDIICESAMGIKINAQTNADSEYVRAVKKICMITHTRVFNIWQRNESTFRLSSAYAAQSRVLKVLHGQTDDVIKARRLELENKTPEQDTTDDVGSKKKLAFLDLLLHSTSDGEPLSNASIREEVDTFMFEGHDTTTSGISFALWNLAENPEVQNKLYAEMEEIFGKDKDRPATHRDLQEMKYLDLVIKESLRMHPPVPMYGRYIREETVINGWTIPAKTNLMIGAYHMNHNPEVFPNPGKFDPERFNFESLDKANRNPYEYVPFSAGPRNCIGQKFALLEMKSSISKMVRNYEVISVGHKPKLTAELILRSANGVFLKLKRRQ